MADLKAEIGRLEGRIANMDNRDENSAILVRQIHQAIHNMQVVLDRMEKRQLEFESGSSISANLARLSALETAALTRQETRDLDYPPPRLLENTGDYFDLLKTLNSDLYPLWEKLFDHSLLFYENSVEASCSTWDNRYAVAFRDYVKIFANGYLLDIGSGTMARPVYLEGYPAGLLSGIDPRKADQPPEFDIQQGVNEFLPWCDESFQTICNATSLDHVLDLERSLDETARLLVENGRFILWYANIKNASEPPKNAKSADGNGASNIDEFHLFHLNDDWFLPMLNTRFTLLDRRVFPTGGFDHVFAVYEKNSVINRSKKS